jgi:hypothetical protein
MNNMQSITRMVVRTAAVCAVLTPMFARDVSAQQTPAPPASPVVQRLTPAKPEDVTTVDGIITALYASISGPKGQPRDFARMRSLMIPEARLMPSVNRPTGGRGVVVLSPNDYIANSAQSLVDIGFREREIARTVETFGSITHVFSTYESYRLDETAPFSRGINSIQLFNDGTRYWVVSIFWDAERAGLQIPEKYLNSK